MSPAGESRDNEYRRILFDSYTDRISSLDPGRAEKVAWFKEYVATNYLALIDLKSSDSILDIGCNRAYMLEAFSELGFANIHGIDLSPGDISEGRRAFPAADLTVGPAVPYLDAHPETFDLITMRAVLEHTNKDDVIPLLRAIGAALRDGGTALIDVPNMAWLFAGHERYMDFTHEGGFTRESLHQVMTAAFADVQIRPTEHLDRQSRRRFRTRFARWALRRLFIWADPDGGSNPIWSRNIVGVGRNPIRSAS